MRISRPTPEVKNPVLINDWENVAYWEESKQNKVLLNKFDFFQIQLEGLGRNITTGKLCNFLTFLNLKLTKNCCRNMNIHFS